MKVRTEARREAILEVASQVFVEFGFKRASMIEIVRRLGGSKSTIYGYYPSKEALFQAVTRAAGEKQIQTAFDELASPDAIDRIDAVLSKFGQELAQFLCRPDLMATHRMVLAEAGVRLGVTYPRPIVDHVEGETAHELIGVHGGLSADEMRVPLILART